MSRREALRVGGASLAALSTSGITANTSTAGSKPRRALVLSGGGAHGAYEAGVIAGLVQQGTLDSYDVICGTSIGTLNAMMVATGQGGAVKQLWSTIAQADILRPKRQFAAFDRKSGDVRRGIAALRFLYGAVRGRVTGFVDSSALQQLIASHVALPNGQVRPFLRPLLWTGTDLRTACGIGFMREAAQLPDESLPTIADMTTSGISAPVSLVADRDLVAALLASTAIPGVFDPVTLPQRAGVFVDGGVLNNAPLSLAQLAGATQIDTVLLVRRVAGSEAFVNAVAVVEEAFGIMRQRILDDAIVIALLQSDPRVRTAIQAAMSTGPLGQQLPASFRELFREDRSPVTIRLIAPSQNLSGSGFQAHDQSIIDRNMQLGFDDLMRTGFREISQPLDTCSTS